MNRVIEWPVHQMNSDRDFSRSSHGFFWKGLMTMNRSARNFWPMVVALAGMTLCAALVPPQRPYRFDAAAVSGLPARNIGSATMSGRIAALDAVDEKGRITVFVGAASGGVLESTNGGTNFKDRQ